MSHDAQPLTTEPTDEEPTAEPDEQPAEFSAPGPPAEMPGDPGVLAGLIQQHAERTGATRLLVGLTGAPGSGKSTLASSLMEALRRTGDGAVVLPMDGFHLAQSVLTELDLQEVKGAPQTFDAHGYLALLQRLRVPAGPLVYAPAFSRKLEEPIAGAIPVPADVRYVITEGNYLLLDESPWTEVRAMLDAVWYIDPGDDIRINRLVRRHIQFGRTPNAALKRATAGSDADNAVLIAAGRSRADLIVQT